MSASRVHASHCLISMALCLTAMVACSPEHATSSSSGASDTSGDTGECVNDVEQGDLPCDVAAVLKSRCQTCHTDPLVGGAKFPLLTYEDAAALRGMTGIRRWQRMADVIEPEGLPHMPYKDAPQLSPDQLETLRSWLSACAPPVTEGEGCDLGE